MSGERIWANSAVVGLVLVAALLIFASLDDRRLWDDEAETALLAKNTLRFGVPVAWDGVELISQECGTDYDSNYLWRQTPWLPIYVAAGSFALLDASTFTARLPFALLGLLAVPSMYLLARRAVRRSADRAARRRLTAPVGAVSLARAPVPVLRRGDRRRDLGALLLLPSADAPPPRRRGPGPRRSRCSCTRVTSCSSAPSPAWRLAALVLALRGGGARMARRRRRGRRSS